MRWLRHTAVLSLGLAASPVVGSAQVDPSTIPVTTGIEATTAAADFDGFDDFVQSVLERWKLPGLAVAAIKDGEVVLSKGFGYRNVEDGLPVTPRTLMAIGSNTKSFTTTLLAMLVDEEKLDWNEPVRTYLPDFRLYDPVATRLMTPRDLVSHQSGLPRHDALWYGRDLTRKELYDRLRYLEPNATFRNIYQYQNLMFMTAGYLAGQVAGSRWEDLVTARILRPLGMTRTNMSVTDMPASDDFSYPYVLVDGDVTRVPFRNIDQIGPAGSINSSVEEMLHYLQFRIDRGEYDGERLLSERGSRVLETPEMAIAGQVQFEELGHSVYGLGVSLTSYHGRTVVQHGGGIDGFISAMSWMPQEKIGVMVLSNLSGTNPVPTIVMRNVYDRLLGEEQVDWVGRTLEQQERAEERQAQQRAEREKEQRQGTSPSHDLGEYAGTYEHPAYGVVTVDMQAGALTFQWEGRTGTLEHYHYDIFRVSTEDPGSGPVEGLFAKFAYNGKGEIDRLAIPLEPAVSDIVFERKQ
jgi:CubicO group peptidase (beta-lactamase class C family)